VVCGAIGRASVRQEGNIIKWYGVVTDIEDRKRVEEALRRSEHCLAEAQRLSQKPLSHASAKAFLKFVLSRCEPGKELQRVRTRHRLPFASGPERLRCRSSRVCTGITCFLACARSAT
jgi:PAS domain-containing protein